MAKQKYSDNHITSLNDNWGCDVNDAEQRPFSGEEVQKFIKEQLSSLTMDMAARVGFIDVRTDQTGEDLSKTYLYAWVDENAKDKWEELDNSEKNNTDNGYLLACTEIPIEHLPTGGTSYKQSIYVVDSNTQTVGSPAATFKVYVKTSVIELNGANWETTITENVPGTLYIKKGTSTKKLGSCPSGKEDAPNYYNVSIPSDYIQKGTNSIRVIWKPADSNYSETSIGITVEYIDFGVEMVSDFTSPYQTEEDVKLIVKATGAIDKRIYLLLDDDENPTTESPEDVWGTEAQTYTQRAFSTATGNITFNLGKMSTGIHSGKVWMLTQTTSTLDTPLTFQFMVSDGSEDLLFIFNNVRSDITNWNKCDVVNYSFYGAGQTDFTFVFWSETKDSKYFTYNVADNLPSTSYTLSPQLELLDTETTTNLPVWLSVYKNDGSDITIETKPLNSIEITIDASQSFNPTDTTEDDFVFNPKSMSNGANKNIVYNEASNKLLTIDWENSSSTMDWINGGWQTDDDGNRCLRLLAGSKIKINKEDKKPFIFSGSKTTKGSSLQAGWTFEIDCAFRNVSNPDTAVVRLCTEKEGESINSKNPNGFKIFPTSAYFCFDNTDISGITQQDIEFCEDARTHITVELIPDLSMPNPRQGGTMNGQAFCRMYINGVINREMCYTSESLPENIIDLYIGSDDCDVDIYGIRCYMHALSTKEIHADYQYSLPSIEDKKSYRDANDICDDDGYITYGSPEETEPHALGKYNTLLFVADSGNRYPDYRDKKTKYSGQLYILTVTEDSNGNTYVDTENSAYFSKVQIQGQGSSSRNYYKYNATWTFKDGCEYCPIKSDGNVDTDNKTADHNYFQFTETLEDGTVNPITPKATTLVGKLNYASSMQSHKEGSLEMYEALKSQMGIESNLQAANHDDPINKKSLIRTSVLEKPYLLFVQEGTSTKFYGLMTFGAAKGDDNTYGVDKFEEDEPNIWIGGANQSPKITLMFTPWIDSECQFDSKHEEIIYNGDVTNDGKYENGYDIEMGNWKYYKYMRDYQNFIYKHSYRLRYYKGSEMPSVSEKPEFYNTGLEYVTYQYWLTGTEAVMRYDFINQKWVEAGVTGEGMSEEAVATSATVTKIDDTEILGSENLGNDYEITIDNVTYRGSGEIYNAFINLCNEGNYSGATEIIKSARAEHLRNHMSEYADVEDVIMNFSYTLFIAASDNLAKNSYMYLDKMKDGDVRPLIRHWRDDDDTIFRINNVGAKAKPYWIELHDSTPLGESNPEDNTYFTASKSGYYGTLYYAFHEDLKNRNVAYDYSIVNVTDRMISAMATLGADYKINGTGDTTSYASVLGCFNRYFFSIQKYFPAVAYNETARLLYEEAQIGKNVAGYGDVDAGYESNLMAMSLGDFYQGELSYLTMRCYYMCTFAMSYSYLSRFGYSIKTPTDSKNYQNGYYMVDVTASTKQYVSSMLDQTHTAQNYPTKLEAGETTMVPLMVSADRQVSIVGTNYLSGIGDWHEVANAKGEGDTISLTSNRVIEFIAGNSTQNSIWFNAGGIGTLPQTIKTIDLQNVTSCNKPLDLTEYKHLEVVKINGTNIKTLVLPSSTKLKNVVLPKKETILTSTGEEVTVNGLEEIEIGVSPNLNVEPNSTCDISKVDTLKRITIKTDTENPIRYATEIDWLSDYYERFAALNKESDIIEYEVNLNGVNWTLDASSPWIDKLVYMKSNMVNSRGAQTTYNFNISGTIVLTGEVTLEIVQKIANAFGLNAFKSDADLRFSTTSPLVFATMDSQSISETSQKTVRIISVGFAKINSATYSTSNKVLEVSDETNESCVLTAQHVDNNTEVTFNATINGLSEKGKNTSVTVSKVIVVEPFKYPSASDVKVICGSQFINTANYPYNLTVQVSSAVTASYTTALDESSYGKYTIKWKVSGATDNFTFNVSPDDEGYYNVKTLIASCSDIPEDASQAITFIAYINYIGQTEEVNTYKKMYVGKEMLDTFGYIYASDGVLYPTLNDLPMTSHPVGIVVVPARHTDDRTSRIMSLNDMSCATPSTGMSLKDCQNETHNSIIFGNKNVNIEGLADLSYSPNINGDTTTSESELGTESNYNGNFSFKNSSYTGATGIADELYYYGSITNPQFSSPTRMIASPFVYPDALTATTLPVNELYKKNGTCTGDYNGRENTAVIISGATAQADWTVSETLVSSLDPGYYAAACSCARYHVDMDSNDLMGARCVESQYNEETGVYRITYQGDWYLPSCGELCYLMPKHAKILEVLNEIKAQGYAAEGFERWQGYWSSTEGQSGYQKYLVTNTGVLGQNFKSFAKNVRAFLAVS